MKAENSDGQGMIERMRRVVGSLFADDHMREVMRGSIVALIIRSSGTLLGFIVSLIVARVFGAAGSGIFYLAIAILAVTSTFSRLGFDNTVVRFIASNSADHNWNSVRYVFRMATILVGSVSIVLAIALLVVSEWASLKIFNDSAMKMPLLIAAIALLPYSLSLITAEALRGLRKIVECQLIKTVLISLITLVLFIPFIKKWQVNGAIAAYAAAIFLTAAIGWQLWRWALANSVRENSTDFAQITLRQLFQSAWPLFGAALTAIIVQQSATILLGMWQGTIEVGQFNVASRIANLLIFPLIAMISILAPKFSLLHSQKLHKELEYLAKRSTNLLTLISLPLAIIVAIYAEEVLTFFGPEFREAVWVLRILLLGMVVNVATGPVSNVLIMTGQEKTVRFAMTIGAAIVIALCVKLIPGYGATGAAVATSVGIGIQNSMMAFIVKKRLGFWTLGF